MNDRTALVFRCTHRLDTGACFRSLCWVMAAAVVLATPAARMAEAQVAAAPPSVNAGADQTIIITNPATLDGTATDDGVPSPLTVTWSQESGPGNVTFANSHAVDTTATFSASGVYVLRLTATDGASTISDDVTIEVMSTYVYSTQYEFDADPSTAEGVIDGDAADANGTGVLTKLGTGTGNTGSGITGGVLHYIDNTGTGGGSNGYYWVKNPNGDISYTVDMRVKVNGGVAGGTTNDPTRRSMGFSGGSGMNRGLRLNQLYDIDSYSCSTGSVMFNGTTKGVAPEGCVNLSQFRSLRVTVNTQTGTLTVYDLDSGMQLTQAPGALATSLAYGPISNKGGFHIGSMVSGGTTLTDFELDYFRILLGTAIEDGTTLIQSLISCSSSVTPLGVQTASARLPDPVSPSQVAYTVGNDGGAPITYTVAEVDPSGAAFDHSWLAVDKTGGAVAVGGQDAVTASLNTTGLAAGTYNGYLKFTVSCGPSPIVYTRQITLTVYECGFEVIPDCGVLRTYLLDNPAVAPAPQSYELRNKGGQVAAYRVDEVNQSGTPVDYAWLSLDKATGTVPANGTETVTASIHPTGLPSGSHTAYLSFTATDCPATPIIRALTLTVVAPGRTMTFEYDGNVHPLTAGFVLKNESPMPVSQGAVEDDPEAIDGKVWRIRDTSSVLTKFVTAPSPFMSDGVGATVIGRIRVRGNTDPAAGGLFIWNNPSISAEVHWGGPSGRIKELARGKETLLSDPSQANDGFHIVRMTSVGTNDCNRVIRVYFDEDPAPALEIADAAAASSAVEGFGFGAGSASGTYDIAFDWVAGTNAGAFAPGEEVAVIGRSLVATYGFWCADADGDSDVDLIDFSAMQLCYTGPDGYGFEAVKCACYDRDQDGDVDSEDLKAFEKCFTGPAIAKVPSQDCP